MSLSTPEGADSVPTMDSSEEVVFNPQYHSSRKHVLDSPEANLSCSQHLDNECDAEGDVADKKGHDAILQELTSLRHTLLREVRNLCSEAIESTFDVRNRLAKDMTDLRSDVENQLSDLHYSVSQLERSHQQILQTLDIQEIKSTRPKFNSLQENTSQNQNKNYAGSVQTAMYLADEQDLDGTSVRFSCPSRVEHNTKGTTPTPQSSNTNGGSQGTVNPFHASNHGQRGATNTKPQLFDGNEELEEYLAQFQIISEINGWDYTTKYLHLAGCLKGPARSILSELNQTERRDYNSLVRSLNTRYGSVERAEIFRARLQTRMRGKDESIPELAQAVRKLTRQAYPSAPADITDVLAIDHFIDALPDIDMRLRIREAHPKNVSDAESQAIRLETFRLADKQRDKRLVRTLQKETDFDVKSTGINASTMDSSTKHFQEEVCKTIKDEFSSLRGDFKSVSQDFKQVVHSLRPSPPHRLIQQNGNRDYNFQNREGVDNITTIVQIGT